MKKGFTLIEVLGVIVILAVILLIAFPTYTVVRERINESIYESKRQNILSNANQYASETNRQVFLVKDLIESGLLSPDNELGEYIDPITDRDMSCDIINAVYENNQYHVSITESDVCYEEDELENLYGMVEMHLYDTEGNELEASTWQQENAVEVRYEIKSEYRNYERYMTAITWSGEGNKSCTKENLSDCSSYQVTAESIKNVEVRLQITFDVNGTEITSETSTRVLLDLQRPGIVGNVNVDNSTSTSIERQVSFEVSDYGGSGVSSYSVVTSPTCSGREYEENKKTASDGSQTEYLGNGTYYICVEDNAGNKSRDEDAANTRFTVENVDGSSRTITYSIGSNTPGTSPWYKNLTIRGTVNTSADQIDRVISCTTTSNTCEPTTITAVNGNTFNISLTNNSKGQRVCARVLDKSGNISENTCSSLYYVDTNNPGATWSIGSSTSGSNGWYKSMTLRANVTDNGSGVSSVKYCVTTSNTCTPNQNATISNGNVNVPLGNNSKAQKACIRVTDKAGRESNVICSTAYKVDTTNPSASFSTTNATTGSNGWYKSLSIVTTVSDNGSGVSSVKYCTTTGSSCTPNTNASISSNKFTVSLGSNANAQKVCVNVTDKAGRTSGTKCSSSYKVDTTNPSVGSISIASSSSGSNGWYKSLALKATLSDSHSGVASAKYCITTGSSCTPNTGATVKNNSITMNLVSNGSAQQACVQTTDKAGRVSSTKCSGTYKVDINTPSISFSVASSTSGSNGWYKALSIKTSLSDIGSGVASAKYCITTGSTCTPNTNASISNNSFTVSIGGSASARRICGNVTDKSGRVSSTKCSGTYKVDTNNPTISSVSATTSNNTITVKVSGGSDSHSGIQKYEYSKNGSSWVSSTSTSYTFSGLSDGTYTVYARAVDKAGRVGSNKSTKITVITQNPDNYDWSKSIACNATKFKEVIDNGKFASYIEHQQFRNAMYDCATTTESIIRNSRTAQRALIASSRFQLVSVTGKTRTASEKCRDSWDDCKYSYEDDLYFDEAAGAFMNTVYSGKALVLSASASTKVKNSPFNTTAWECEYDNYYVIGNAYVSVEIGNCEYESGERYGNGQALLCVGEAVRDGDFRCEEQYYMDGAGRLVLNGKEIKANETGFATEFFDFVPSVGAVRVTQYQKDTSSGYDYYTQYRAQKVYIQIFKI